MGTIGEILVNLRLEVSAFKAGIKVGLEGGKKLETQLKHVGNASRQLGMNMASASRNTFMFGITMKFFGMQVAKTMQKIMRDVTSTFTRIMESSGFTGRSIRSFSIFKSRGVGRTMGI